MFVVLVLVVVRGYLQGLRERKTQKQRWGGRGRNVMGRGSHHPSQMLHLGNGGLIRPPVENVWSDKEKFGLGQLVTHICPLVLHGCVRFHIMSPLIGHYMYYVGVYSLINSVMIITSCCQVLNELVGCYQTGKLRSIISWDVRV